MPEELSELLERVATDGAARSALTTEAVRTRGRGIRRRRAIGGTLGAAVMVCGVLTGAALLARPGGSAAGMPGTPGSATGAASHGVASTTLPTPSRTGPKPCRQVAASNDIDGDCRADAVRLTGNTLVVQATRAGRLTVKLTGLTRPTIAGSTDTDGDGFSDIWLAAGPSRYALVHSSGTALTLLTGPDGQPVTLALPGPLHNFVVSCTAVKVAVFTRNPTHLHDGTEVTLYSLVVHDLPVSRC